MDKEREVPTIQEISPGMKKKKSVIWPVILLIAAILYDLWPVDIVPDVPVVGWIDDLLITITAGLNLVEKTILTYHEKLKSIVRMIKWGLIFLGVIAISLVSLGVVGIVGILNH